MEQPKRPLTAYFIYLEEQRPKIVTELGEQAKVQGMVAKKGAERWRELSADDKAPYEKKAATAKAEYDKAVEAFKASGGEITRKRKTDKDEKLKKDKDAPKKPSGGGYGQFLAENREKIVKSLPEGSNPITDVAKAAGAQWKALSEAEQKPYVKKFEDKMQEYHAAMDAYKASTASTAAAEADEAAEATTKRAKTGAAPKAKASPKAEPAAKRGQGAGKNKGVEKVVIDAKVLEEAKKAGLEDQLHNLADRSDVKALGKTDNDLLAALKGAKGLVNPARRALLGA